MGFFWIWNPTVTDIGVEFEITAGNVLRPTELTEADVQRCLGVAGLRGVARRWEMREARSAFFTSYADSEDWRDRWQHVWHVSVEGDLDPVHAGELPVGLTELDDLDRSESSFVDDGAYSGRLGHPFWQHLGTRSGALLRDRSAATAPSIGIGAQRRVPWIVRVPPLGGGDAWMISPSLPCSSLRVLSTS